MKPYYRGGILRHLVQRTYIGFGPSRSTRELYLLCRVRELGVAAPEPVAALTHGGLFYRAWLVTKEIPEAKTLADLMLHDEERGRAAMEKLVPHVSKLVQNRILHVDLHPGNVLVGNDDAVYIVDFDKARDYVGAVPKLRDHYVLRWRRAVLKHGLPDLLSEMMSLGLRRTTSA
jgi:3-deoxy-D-manno-octulosonic acid kinase